MGKKRVRVPSLCLGRANRPWCRIFSTAFRSKPTSDSILSMQKSEFSSNNRDDFSRDDPDGVKAGSEIGNKIMVVVDSSLEAKGALEWALSHTIQSQDTIILLHVVKSSRRGSNNGNGTLRAYELLHSLKNMCQMSRPGVQVDLALLEGKEKGPIIVNEAKQQGVSLLVIGQRKQSSILWCLMKRWPEMRDRGGVVEYCIQNASCMTIAVRRKSKKLGGFLITTKRHKKFWLLA
ncbi:hypothetical protein FCV25MIE_10714 [Fagus crenata]